MPAGTFHDLDVTWLAHLRTASNRGVLPPQCYAMVEQVTPPDVAGDPVNGYVEPS